MSRSLYKYRNFSNHTKNIILNSSLYFSSIKNFNDPFDCNLSFKQKYTKGEIRKFFVDYKKRKDIPKSIDNLMREYGSSKKFVELHERNMEKFISNIGVLSLSAKPNNILMWSHYATDHKGLVFEFIPENKKSNLWFSRKLDYKDTYNLLSYATPEDKRAEQFTRLILSKYTDWEYEDEYRVVDLQYQGEKKFNKRELKSIIFGAKADEKEISKFIKLCKDNGFTHIEYKKAKLSSGKFALEFKKIKS